MSARRNTEIDLGLALLSAVGIHGVCYTHREIAAWCGYSPQNIEQIERRALVKLRKRCQSLATELEERQ